MLNDFLKAAGGKLADKWAAASLPALIFWAGGLLAWAGGHGGFDSLSEHYRSYENQSTAIQLGIIGFALLGVAMSAAVVQQLTTPALRLMEGYWPSFADPARRRLVARVERRVIALETEFQRLAAALEDGSPTLDELENYVRLDAELRRLPANRAFQPTAIGNTIRAAEIQPGEKYGLDAVAVWSRLWLTLPEGTQRELTQIRGSLDAAVATCVWGLLFLVFAVWVWWPAVIGVAVVWLTWRFWLPGRAALYGDLVEATFDVHRRGLYEHLRWPLPTDPRAEQTAGRKLTEYLVRGSQQDEPRFDP